MEVTRHLEESIHMWVEKKNRNGTVKPGPIQGSQDKAGAKKSFPARIPKRKVRNPTLHIEKDHGKKFQKEEIDPDTTWGGGPKIQKERNAKGSCRKVEETAGKGRCERKNVPLLRGGAEKKP